jgi:diacylglycerol kinase family enzyme
MVEVGINSVEVSEIDQKTKTKKRVALPLEIKKTATIQYFEQIQPWTIGSIVKNQYFMVIASMGLMAFLMKKMPSMGEFLN